MRDPRITQLAQILVDHSCQLRKGENILIEAIDLPEPTLACRLIELATERGAHPFVSWKNNAALRTLYQTGTDVNLRLAGQFERQRMAEMDAYIGIRGSSNDSQFADVALEKMQLYEREWWKPVHIQTRVPKTKWVVLRYPTGAMAQAANMSSESFEDFYFDACTADYAEMQAALIPLEKKMRTAGRVRIVGPGTDLSFSIRGMEVQPCFGRRNIPDGEIFTAPLRTSVNGVIRFNTTSRYQGTLFDNIELEFRDGRIVRAEASDTDRLNAILDTDDGSRFIGEWAMGCNNQIGRPILNTLFDEKIGGSMHLTPGDAYPESDNGNRSQIHWDLVLLQTPEHGGGEIWLDDELIRKDGRFVPDDLSPLNEGLSDTPG